MVLRRPSTESSVGKNAKKVLKAMAWPSVTQSGTILPIPRNRHFKKRSIVCPANYKGPRRKRIQNLRRLGRNCDRAFEMAKTMAAGNLAGFVAQQFQRWLAASRGPY